MDFEMQHQHTPPSSISHLPDDLQSYLVSFNSSRSNARTLCLVNSHWKQVVERHVKRRIWNSLNVSRASRYDAFGIRRQKSRLVFEAQRPIDTMTAKHALYFSNFSPNDGPTISKSSTLSARFSFIPLSVSDTRQSDSSGETQPRSRSRSFSGTHNARSTSRSTVDSASTTETVQPESLSRPINFNAPHDAQNAIPGTLDQPFVPGVPENFIERMGEREVSSSVFQVEMDGDIAEIVSGTSTPSSSKQRQKTATRGRTGFGESGTGASTPISSVSKPLPSTSNHTQKLFTSVSKPLYNSDVVAVPDDVDGVNLDALHTVEVVERDTIRTSDEEDVAATDDDDEGEEGQDHLAEDSSNSDDINQPLNAYDWAGPVSSSVKSHPSTVSRRKVKIKPTYKFELDPLDSFETWILTLAIHKPHPTSVWSLDSNHSSSLPSQPLKIGGFTFLDGIETGPAIRLGPSNAVRGGMRWEKRVAEGLDRIYREWHLVDRLEDSVEEDSDDVVASEPRPSKSKGKERSVDIPTSNINKTRSKSGLPRPATRILEFDGDSSCVLEIQPHPIERVKLPSSYHSYDSGYGASYSNYGNTHYPYGYGLSSNLNRNFEQEKTSLTFHCEEIRINAHRLLSTLEDLEKREMNEIDKDRIFNSDWLNSGQYIIAGVANSTILGTASGS